MPSDVDAVIAALRTILHEAETRVSEYRWKTHVVNRWIGQLPGARRGRWQKLKLLGESAEREDLITHLRATLAYLETDREAIAAERRTWWPFTKAARQPAGEPKEVAVIAEKPQASEQAETLPPRPKWLN